MRKITYLLSLFLMMVGTAMADVIKSPTSTLLTTDELNAATTDVVLAIKCISETNSYCSCAKTRVISTTDPEICMGCEPTGDGTTHNLKKYTPTNAQGEGYLQATNYGIGAKATAQKFTATNATLPGGTDTPVEGTNTENGYIVRFAWEGGAKWINVQAPTGNPTYNTGTGLYTMYNVHAVNLPVTDLANLSNTKAYTLRTNRSDLVANNDGSRIATTNDISGTFDASNTKYQFALLKNTSGSYFLYSISASKFVNKTGDLVNSPAEPILFKDGNAAGTFVLYFDASHYINMGGKKQLAIDDWSTADEGNSYTITPVAEFSPSEELLNSINTVDVTVNFIVDGKTYSTANKRFTLNTAINAETFTTDLNGTYLTYASTDVETVTAETSTINVTCTAQTPFVISENFENAKWYLIDMHSNDTGADDINSGAKNYLWTATTDANAYTTAEVTLPKYNTKQSATFSDNMLWCFVGDVVDGFVIYNKAAGSEYALAKPATGNTAVILAAVGEATPFRIYKSTDITGATCFKKQGDDYYVNTQAVSNVKVLRGWNKTDGGSSCRFFAPDHYLLNYAADIAGPANSLGTAQYFNTEGKFESLNSAMAAANADNFNAEATANLEAILADYVSDEANATPNDATITDGGYYRLMNYQYKNYMTSGLDGTTNTLWGGLSTTDAPGTAGTIVKITADGDNYKMFAQGLEFGQITDASARLNLTGGGLFTINNTGNKFTFMDVSTCDPEPHHPTHRAIHQAEGNPIVGWETGADATKWYLIPATTLDLPLNAAGDGKSYATTFLPFGVTLPDNVKAYIVTAAKDGKATISEVADIPANQGVVLVSETAATTATLTLGTASANCTGNKLSGTNPRITISAKNDYYIFGNGDDGVGFYHPNSNTLKENRAYLPASEVSGIAVNGFKLDFGGVNTGIEAVIQADEANATYYDLSGRRVIRPAKGIYVKNGRKVYVK